MSLMTVSTGIMTVYTLQRLHKFTHKLVISSLAKRLKVSILPNVRFLWCTARRSPHSFSQCFLARKIFTLRFYHCGSHILQRPPLVPTLGDKPTPSPKSRKSHHVLLPEYPQTRKTSCYSTKPTHISPVLCAVNMVIRYTNRSLGSLASTTTIQNSTFQVLLHSHTIINILLLGSPRLINFTKMLTNFHG
jgi:hypothetical protein